MDVHPPKNGIYRYWSIAIFVGVHNCSNTFENITIPSKFSNIICYFYTSHCTYNYIYSYTYPGSYANIVGHIPIRYPIFRHTQIPSCWRYIIYIWVWNCFVFFCFSVFGSFFGSPVLSVSRAICSILELEAAISNTFCNIWTPNLSFSVVFATFWCSNCSCRMVFST